MGKTLLFAALLAVPGCLAEIDEDTHDPSAPLAPDAGAEAQQAALVRVCSRPADRLCMVWVEVQAGLQCGDVGSKVPQVVGDEGARQRAINALRAAPALSIGAEMRLARRLREAAASRSPPTDLDFDEHKEESAEAFASWLRARRRAVEETVERVGRIAARSGVVPADQARAARVVAGVYADFAAHLETMEIPNHLTVGKYSADAQAAFCDAIAQAAEPLWKKALQAVDECEKRAPPGHARRCTELVADVGGARVRALRSR